MKKELYVAHESEVLEITLEQTVLAESINPNMGDPGLGGGGWN